MGYCEREDIEKMFGRANVAAWADVDNTGVEDEIAARVEWAIDSANALVDARLRRGPYTLPFTLPYDQNIINLEARFAGLELYDSRRITDSKGEDEVSHHRKKAEDTVRQILGGQLKLDVASTKESPDYPRTI